MRAMHRKLHVAFTATVFLVTALSSRATYLTDVDTNGTLATAQNLDPFFSLDFDPVIGVALFVEGDHFNTSTETPHASVVRPLGNVAQRDWFSFSAIAFTRVYLDIDFALPRDLINGGLDTYLRVFDIFGNLVASNDDAAFGDPGSDSSVPGFPSAIMHLDSFLEVFTPNAGLYYVEVSAYPQIALTSEQEYTLHVSVPFHPTSDPAGVSDSASTASLLGLAFAALAGLRRGAPAARSFLRRFTGTL
jgi:hypothetical protein